MKVKNYNLNVRDSDFKNAFLGILNFTVGILKATLMLVTTLCQWLYDDVRFKMLVTYKIGHQHPNWHRHILSPISVTNIDVAVFFYFSPFEAMSHGDLDLFNIVLSKKIYFMMSYVVMKIRLGCPRDLKSGNRKNQ